MVDTWPLLINCYLDLIRLIWKRALKLLADDWYMAFIGQLLSGASEANMAENFKANDMAIIDQLLSGPDNANIEEHFKANDLWLIQFLFWSIVIWTHWD